jgi:prepilin peptidase CpaA
MTPAFFPSIAFGWTFLGTLFGFLFLAAYIDCRTFLIPRWISLALLPLGIMVNALRGCWLGSAGRPVWFASHPGPLLGGLDGLTFAVCGALFGFVSFFILWILKACGGGDVKLFTAVGAWFGPVLSLLVMAGSLTFVCSWIILAFFARFAGKGMSLTRMHPREPSNRVRGMRVSYSLPLALSSVVVGLIAWNDDLFKTSNGDVAGISRQDRNATYESR